MHLPGKKLLGQVLAMKLAVRPSTRRPRGNDEQGDEEDGQEDDASSTAATTGGRPERMVHTPVPPWVDKSATFTGAGQEVVDWGEVPAGAPWNPLPEARSGSSIQSRPPSATPTGVTPARHSRPSFTARRVDLAAEATTLDEPAPADAAPRVVPIEVVAQEHRTWRPVQPLLSAAVPDALPAAGGPLEGNLLEPGTPLPGRVHEANLTRDEAGNPVFQVYRPEGSRFYAQDE